MKKGLTVVEGADLNGDEHFSCREELSLWCTVNAESLVRNDIPVCPGFSLSNRYGHLLWNRFYLIPTIAKLAAYVVFHNAEFSESKI